MAKELETRRKCPKCDCFFTKISVGKRGHVFYVHTGTQLDNCEAISDTNKWLQRCMVAFERVQKKRETLGPKYNKFGQPKLFGELE